MCTNWQCHVYFVNNPVDWYLNQYESYFFFEMQLIELRLVLGMLLQSL